MVLGKIQGILKIFLKLTLTMGGQNQETDGDDWRIKSNLGQDLSLQCQSLKLEDIVI